MENIKEKKLLFTVPRISGGGAERVVTTLCSYLADQKYNIAVMIDFNDKNEYKISDNLTLIRLNTEINDNQKWYEKNFFARISKRRALAREFNPDITIAFLEHTIIYSYLQCIFSKSKFVPAIRNNPSQVSFKGLKGKIIHILRNLIVVLSDAVFVQNNSQKIYFPKFLHKKIFVVPNPINEIFFARTKKTKKRIVNIVTTGRLTDQKNQLLAIKAFAKISDKYSDIILKIYGEGHLRSKLQEHINRLDLQKRILLVGRNNNLPKEYENADLFILSSDYEGMPNVLLEAMASGVPVISTDCPTGPSDIIVNNENGILIPVGDVDSLANTIEELINDPDKANDMANRAYERVKEEYNLEKVAQLFTFEIKEKLF